MRVTDFTSDADWNRKDVIMSLEGQAGTSIDAIQLAIIDNVATAIKDLEPGTMARVGLLEDTRTVKICDEIPYGHKFALKPIAKGDDILKYGEVIGRAVVDIALGVHAHVHNIESLRGRGDLEESR
jgi:altronate dehydratase small subunit